MIAVLILVWTRYIVPSGLIKNHIIDTIRIQLNAHILAKNVLLGLSSFLYRIDQLPRNYVETYRLAQQLAKIAIGQQHIQKFNFNVISEASRVLEDSRFFLSVIAAPNDNPLFRWQEEDYSMRITRDKCLEKWTSQCGHNIALAFPGCEFEYLLPDVYYSACNNANECIRPLFVRAVIRYLLNTIRVMRQRNLVRLSRVLVNIISTNVESALYIAGVAM